MEYDLKKAYSMSYKRQNIFINTKAIERRDKAGCECYLQVLDISTNET